MDALQNNARYTYADYYKWDDGARWELIDGVAYAMSPAPGRVHQDISFNIARILGNYLDGKPCKAYCAPFDVRLFAAGDDDDTVVQPDIVVVCDKSKLDAKGCNGAPDMIVEILSASTASRDRVVKHNLYLRAGVREYWIVDPENMLINVFVLNGGEYVSRAYGGAGEVPSHVLAGFKIDLSEVFEGE